MLKTAEFKELFQSADWKQEKHVPVIDAPDTVKMGMPVKVRVTIGKEIPHPNTTEHHIVWAGLYFLPEGDTFPYEVGRTEFSSHGASVKGPNTSGIYTDYTAEIIFKTDKPGTLFASSYCNIHGLWQSEKQLTIG